MRGQEQGRYSDEDLALRYACLDRMWAWVMAYDAVLTSDHKSGVQKWHEECGRRLADAERV